MKVQLAAAVAPLPTYTARVEAAVRTILEQGRAHIDETGEDEWLERIGRFAG